MKTLTFTKSELGTALFKNLRSTTRTKMGGLHLNTSLEPGGPKLSALGQLIDDIFLGKVSVYEISSSLVVEIRHSVAPTLFAKIDKKPSVYTVTVEDLETLTPRDADFAVALYRAAFDRGTCAGDQLLTYFKQCEAGNADDESIYDFCDSFYREVVSAGQTVTAVEDRALREEFLTALTGGMAQFCNFGGIKQVTDAYDSKKYAMPEDDEKKEASTAPEADSPEAFLKDCIAGKYALQYNWSDEQKAHIRPLSILNDFYPTKEFVEIVKKVYRRMTKAIAKRDAGTPFTDRYAYGKDDLNLMALGKPGTGKSYVAERAAAALQMPYICLSLSKNSEEDVYKGMTLIVDGKPEFVETDFSKFFDQGMFCVLEEPNLAPADVNMALAKVLDESGALIIDGRGTKYRSPLTVIMACENTGIEGTKPNSPAFSNRFRTKWLMPDPTADDFKGMLAKQTGQSKRLVNWVYNAYTRVIDWLKSDEVGESEVANVLSIRTCEGVIENMQDGMDAKRAIETSILPSIAEIDQELAEQCRQEVLDDIPECKCRANV